jgi:hypothetical protein
MTSLDIYSNHFRGNTDPAVRLDITGEELDEEDVEAIIEMRDSSEESFSPELEAAVDRLAAFGFDRILLTPTLLVRHGDDRERCGTASGCYQPQKSVGDVGSLHEK